MLRLLESVKKLIEREVESQKVSWVGPLLDTTIVYLWDPIFVGESRLPCIIVHPKKTDYIQRGSQYDQKNCSFDIRIVLNRKHFFDETWDYQDTVRAIEQWVKMSEVYNQWESLGSSIAWLIQKNTCFHLDGEKIAEILKITTVEYTFNDKRQIYTLEVILSCEAFIIWNR
jgi:hypothetical protein